MRFEPRYHGQNVNVTTCPYASYITITMEYVITKFCLPNVGSFSNRICEGWLHIQGNWHLLPIQSLNKSRLWTNSGPTTGWNCDVMITCQLSWQKFWWEQLLDDLIGFSLLHLDLTIDLYIKSTLDVDQSFLFLHSDWAIYSFFNFYFLHLVCTMLDESCDMQQLINEGPSLRSRCGVYSHVRNASFIKWYAGLMCKVSFL